MRRSSLLLLLACLVCSVCMGYGRPAGAQPPCTSPDLVAVYFENDDINFTPTLSSVFTMRLVLLNPSLPGADAFEVQVTLPNTGGSLFRLAETLPPGTINIGDTSDATTWTYVAGYPTPVPPIAGHVTLVTWDMLAVSNPGQRDIYLKPVEYPFTPSIPGSAAYNYTDSEGNPSLRPMASIAGTYIQPAARLWPQTPLVYCDGTVNPDFTMTISGEGETLVAGAAANATDGYDGGLDLPDTTPLLTFPRPAFGGNFAQDMRAVYDATQAAKTWTFTARPDWSAGNYQVDLSFLPTFNAASGIDILLFDHATGDTVNLRETGLQYSYVDGVLRTFDLTIGAMSPPPPQLVVDLAVSCGLYSDPLTRAATRTGATDGFDPAYDFPEPSPPPGNYVSACFEQAGWPLGPRFSSDVRAPFDPNRTSRVWPLLVETDRNGPVVLSFTPGFEALDGINLWLRDLSTGQVFDLFPSLTYIYNNYGSATARRFELTIGAVSAPELAPVSRNLPAGWSMVGCPLVPTPGDDTMGEVLIDPSPGYGYAFTFDRYLGYQSVPATTTALNGKGYWYGTSAAFNWSMTGTRALDGVSVPLSNGWNLVGNANWFPGPFEGLRIERAGATYEWLSAVAAGLVSADVQGWNHTLGSYYVAADLQPWQGYWINALANDLTLHFHWPNFMQVPARMSTLPAPAKASPGAWQSDLLLRDAGDRILAITYGADSAATGGFDAMYDRPLPPTGPGGGLSFSFQHPEWGLAAGGAFARDLLGPKDEIVRWPVAISAPAAGRATLNWNPSDWPAGTDYQLYFPHENRVVVMSMREQTSLAIEVGPQPLTIIMRTPDMTSGVDETPIAGDFALSAQPNPFNPATTVAFNLPQRGRAEVRIYSVRGELVAVIGGGDYEAGLHREVWRGLDRSGRDVPSGAYFGRLYVDGRPEGQVARMSLVR